MIVGTACVLLLTARGINAQNPSIAGGGGGLCGDFKCQTNEECISDDYGYLYCKVTAGMPCGDFKCQPDEICTMDTEGYSYCQSNNLVTDPCETWSCTEREICITDEAGSPFCLQVEGPWGMMCGDFECQPTETCATDDSGYSYCKPYDMGTDPCENWYCNENEVCSVDDAGFPFCKGFNDNMCGDMVCGFDEICKSDEFGNLYCGTRGVLCGEIECQSDEKCEVNEFGSYCIFNDVKMNPCENWYCNANEVCLVENGLALCVTPCGDFNCKPAETCETDDYGYSYCKPYDVSTNPCENWYCNANEVCSVENGLALCVTPCGDFNCKPAETCETDVGGYSYCKSSDADTDPCSNWYCNENEVCSVDQAGLAFCMVVDGVQCGDVVCQLGEICTMDTEGYSYCQSNNLVTDPCETWSCTEREICITDEAGSPFCLQVEGPWGMMCGDFECQPTETCATDDSGYSYCKPYDMGTDPCENWYCNENEVCSVDDAGFPFCKGFNDNMCGDMVCGFDEICKSDEFGNLYCGTRGVLCGEIECQSDEKCEVSEFGSYCIFNDVKMNPCENWYCNANEVCSVENGLALCVTPCGDFNCKPAETCETDVGGYSYCKSSDADTDPCSNWYCNENEVCSVDQAGLAFCMVVDGVQCGDVVCQLGEICTMDTEGYSYCQSNNLVTDPCETWSCTEREICITDEAGSPFCSQVEGPWGMMCGDFECQPTETCATDDSGYSYCKPYDMGTDPCENWYCNENEVCSVDDSGFPFCKGFNDNMCGDMVCGFDEICKSDEFGNLYCGARGVLCGEIECQSDEKCEVNEFGSYCIFNDVKMNPCENWYCNANEVCSVENGLALCVTPCGDFNCKPAETCETDDYGYSYCKSSDFIADPCENWYCNENEVCTTDENGLAFCHGGVWCGFVICQAGETCSMDTNGESYCKANRMDVDSCEYCSSTEVCIEGSCFDQSIMCGETICTEGEKCEYRSHVGYFTCIAPCGEDNFCGKNEKCLFDKNGGQYCAIDTERPQMDPCGLTFCNGVDEVCSNGSCELLATSTPVTKSIIVKGTFGLGDCSEFQVVFEQQLSQIIKSILKDEYATITFGCGSIHFIAQGNVANNISITQFEKALKSYISNHPELRSVLGPQNAFRFKSLPHNGVETCDISHGTGLLSDGICFINRCFPGYHLQHGQYGYACINNTPTVDNSRVHSSDNDLKIILIVSLSVGACLFIIVIISLCYWGCTKKESSEVDLPAITVCPAVYPVYDVIEKDDMIESL